MKAKMPRVVKVIVTDEDGVVLDEGLLEVGPATRTIAVLELGNDDGRMSDQLELTIGAPGGVGEGGDA